MFLLIAQVGCSRNGILNYLSRQHTDECFVSNRWCIEDGTGNSQMAAFQQWWETFLCVNTVKWFGGGNGAM